MRDHQRELRQVIHRGKKLGELDLVAMPVAPVLSMLEENGKRPFYRSIDSGLIPKKSVLDNLAALEQITFIGYPSGLYDDYNKTPSSGKAGLPRPLGTTTRVSASSSLTHLYSRAPAAVPPSSSTRQLSHDRRNCHRLQAAVHGRNHSDDYEGEE